MTSSSDSETEEVVPLQAPKPPVSTVPFIVMLCMLSYVYGMWLGAYMCPK